MPAAYKRCVSHVKAQGKSTQSAHAICTSVNAGGVRQVRSKEREAQRAARRERRS